jgi:predicted phosphodiesterase
MKKNSIRLKSNKVIVIGGIYSNVEAFKKFLTLIKKSKYKKIPIINTGDIFAYFSEPNKAIDLVRKNKITSIMGNCEESIAFDADDCGCGFKKNSKCDLLTTQWFPYSKKNISIKNKQWLKKLPYEIILKYKSKKYLVCHGSPRKINEFILPSTSKKIIKNLIKNFNGIIAGHSGIPFTRYLKKDFWHNSGAIGLPPHDGTNKGWYSIIDLEKDLIEHKSFSYNYLKTFNKMMKINLNVLYAKTLKSGYWPSIDIFNKYDLNILKSAIPHQGFIFR